MKSSTTFRRAMYSARLRCSVRNWEFEPEIRFSVLPSTQSETPVPPKIHFETNPLRLREKHTLMSLPYRLFATPVQPKISSTRYVEPSRRSFSPMLWITSLKVVTRPRDVLMGHNLQNEWLRQSVEFAGGVYPGRRFHRLTGRRIFVLHGSVPMAIMVLFGVGSECRSARQVFETIRNAGVKVRS